MTSYNISLILYKIRNKNNEKYDILVKELNGLR